MAVAAQEDAWIRAFTAEVENGHAGRTLELVVAVQGKSRGVTDTTVKIGQLCSSLDRESSAAGRNRLLRRWLADNREGVLGSWTSLGFPAPPRSQSGAKALDLGEHRVAATSAPRHAACSSRYAGVAVFDFDQTLTTRHVGVFEDLSQARDRSFGGSQRVQMLCSMMSQLKGYGAAVVVVTRNSRHVVQQALERVGLLQYITDGIILGFEDYDDEVPKSCAVRDSVLAMVGVSESNVLFIDDDPANISDMQEKCPRAALLQCPRQGLQRDECDKIVAWAESSLS